VEADFGTSFLFLLMVEIFGLQFLFSFVWDVLEDGRYMNGEATQP